MDAAREWTDKQLEALERKIEAAYKQAAEEMRAKQLKAMEKYRKEREMRLKALDNTPEAEAAYKRWLQAQAVQNEWMRGMVEELSESASRANQMALATANDALPRIYAENANRAAFDIDRAVNADTHFTLVNEDAVRYLMERPEDMPIIREVIPTGPVYPEEMPRLQSLRKNLDSAKDIAWNRRQFTSAITQGILQGESIPNIVKRTEDIYGKNRAAATRAVRTAVTSAENAGRVHGYTRAERLGIDIEIVWEATLDERTRESHRLLDGESVKPGEPFSNGLEFPGDPYGEPAETYNCRCRANGRVVGFDGERGDWADEFGERWSRLPDGMTYEEWKHSKPKTVAQLKGENGRWATESRIVGSDWFNPQESPTSAIDKSAQVWKFVPNDMAERGEKLMSAAPEQVRAVWSKFEGELRFNGAPSGKDSAFYKPSASAVYIKSLDAVMSDTRGAMNTWFHEFGHMIDNLAGRLLTGRKYADISYKRGLHESTKREIMANVDARWKALKTETKSEEFAKWLAGMKAPATVSVTAEDVERALGLGYIRRSEANHLLGNIARGKSVDMSWRVPRLADAAKKEWAYQQLSNELYDMPDTAHALMDMVQAATGGKSRGLWGHSDSYFKGDKTLAATEAFAEFFSAYTIASETPETLALLREWVPESCQLFEEILEEVSRL